MFVDKVFIRPHGTNEVSLSWTSESTHCRSYIFINGSLVVSGFMAGMTGRNATLPVPSHSTFLIEVHEFTDENTLPNSTEPSPHVRPLIAWNNVENACAYKEYHSAFDSDETETLLATVPAVTLRPT